VSWRGLFRGVQYQIQSSLLRGKLRSEARAAFTARAPKNTPKAMIKINMIFLFSAHSRAKLEFTDTFGMAWLPLRAF
jgi:hypothetical protein